MRPLEELIAADCMRAEVVCVRAEQSIADVERILVEARISGAPVVAGDRLVGVISHTDITRAEVVMSALDGQVSDELQSAVETAAPAAGTEPDYHGFHERLATLRVQDVMRREVQTCSRQTPITDVAATMADEQIHRVIVVDGERPIGIITSLDIVRLVARLAYKRDA